MTLLDEHLPAYDTVSRHSVVVRASPERAWTAVRQLDLAGAPLARMLFAIRGMVDRSPTAAKWRSRTLRLEDLEQFGFVRLGEVPGREIAVGVAGRFWRPSGAVRRIAPQDFARFAEPGTAKAAMAFWIEPLDASRTRVHTETRVLCADVSARRAFRRYWLVVGPGSGFIRRLALASIRGRAELPGTP